MRRSGRRKEVLTTLFGHSVQAHDDNESDGAWSNNGKRIDDIACKAQATSDDEAGAKNQRDEFRQPHQNFPAKTIR